MISTKERNTIIIPDIETEREVQYPMEPCTGGGGPAF